MHKSIRRALITAPVSAVVGLGLAFTIGAGTSSAAPHNVNERYAQGSMSYNPATDTVTVKDLKADGRTFAVSLFGPASDKRPRVQGGRQGQVQDLRLQLQQRSAERPGLQRAGQPALGHRQVPHGGLTHGPADPWTRGPVDRAAGRPLLLHLTRRTRSSPPLAHSGPDLRRLLVIRIGGGAAARGRRGHRKEVSHRLADRTVPARL